MTLYYDERDSPHQANHDGLLIGESLRARHRIQRETIGKVLKGQIFAIKGRAIVMGEECLL